MRKTMLRRFAAMLLCLALCAGTAMAASIKAKMAADRKEWKPGETITFSGEIRHAGGGGVPEPGIYTLVGIGCLEAVTQLFQYLNCNGRCQFPKRDK